MSLIDRLKKLMDQARLKEYFNYCDGSLISTKTKYRPDLLNKPIGYVRKDNGYVCTQWMQKMFYLHQLVWAWHHGEIPSQIDHIDGDKKNNRIENLRLASTRENHYNMRVRVDSKSKVKNCTLLPSDNWHVKIRANGIDMCIGTFEDLELAELVAIEARTKYHGEFARHG